MNNIINYFIKNTKLLFCVLFFINNSLFAQTLDWVNAVQGFYTETATALAVDVDGNVYTTGYFSGTIDFESNGGGTISLTSSGSYPQAYVQKTDSLGNVMWAKTFDAPGLGGNKIYGICLDDLGNVYLTGLYTYTVDFDPNASVHNKTTGGVQDIFVVKLNTVGNLVWVKTMEGSNSSYALGHSIAVDAAYNVYIAGYFTGTTDFDPSAGNFPLTTLTNNHDMYLQKLDAGGNLIWVKTMVGGTASSQSIPQSIAVDDIGNIYTTGYFSGTVDFDPNSGNHSFSSVYGGYSVFIQKIDNNGDMLWTKEIASTSGLSKSFSLALDNAANVYTVGQFSGTADFDPSTGTYYMAGAYINAPGYPQPESAYVHKLNTDGDFVWAKKVEAFTSSAVAVDVDKNGNVYTTGSFPDTADFDPSAGTATLIAGVGGDFYIQVLDKDGDFVWATNIGGGANSRDIAVDVMGKVYLTGNFKKTVDFDPSTGVDTLTPISISGTLVQDDIFVLKLDASNFLGIENLEISDLGGNVYPNPSTGKINIDLGSLKGVSIRLFTADGKLVYNKKNVNDSMHQLIFEGPVGVYFLELSSGKRKQTYKLIKK